MFKFNQLKTIHLEITNRCQASCPMCTRNFHGGLENPNIKSSDWTLDDFKNIFNYELLHQLDGFYFCGNFGDPIINDNLISMCKYAVKNKDSLDIKIHTNGSARKTEWWIELANSLPKNHMVYIALDGLEDTHNLYRIGTNYETIIKNAAAFISAGGNATWTFLKFKHNEHQVDEAQKRARDLGFSAFTVKSTSRFVGENRFPVYDNKGNTKYYLDAPSDSKLNYIDDDLIKNYKEFVSNAVIDCQVLSSKEIYIDANRQVYPCCFLASVPYIFYNNKDIIKNIRDEMLEQHRDMIYRLVDNDANIKSIKEIIESTKWQTIWDEYWNNKKLIMCARACGKVKYKPISQSKDQFLEKISLK